MFRTALNVQVLQTGLNTNTLVGQIDPELFSGTMSRTMAFRLVATLLMFNASIAIQSTESNPPSLEKLIGIYLLVESTKHRLRGFFHGSWFAEGWMPK
jgi:hypothetical protein